MGETVSLKSAKDGFVFDAYRAPTLDARRGGLVLIHDIFGLTAPIRALADGFAEDGYETLAPACFDRQQRGVPAAGGEGELARARDLAEATPWEDVANDLTAAVAALQPPVFVVGYGWGGAAAWLAACRCEGVAAVSAFYAGRLLELFHEKPRCPIILHFGRRDSSIPPAIVEAVTAAYTDVPIYFYDAEHGFISDFPASYSADCARLSHLRTLQVFALYGAVQSDL